VDDAEARAILREHGEEPPIRGRLNPDWLARAESLRADAPPADYDGGVTDADFVTEAAEPPAIVSERKPRRVKPSARPPLWDRLKGTKSGRPKRKQPRVSLAPLIGNFWALMGSVAGRADVPLGRCLTMQSPVAGEILEDVVKGTVVDTALQPIARARDKGKAVAALMLPPAVVVAIERAQLLPEEQRKAREALLWPILVQSMMMWEEVAGDKVAAMADRAEAEAPSRERAEVNARLIFGLSDVPVPEPEMAGV